MGWDGTQQPGSRAPPRKPAQRHTDSTNCVLNHKETRRDRTAPTGATPGSRHRRWAGRSSSRESRAAAAVRRPVGGGQGGRTSAEWIHLVDLDAAFGRGSNRDLIDTIVGRLDISVELSEASATPSPLTRRSQPAVAGSTSARPRWRTPSGPDGSSVSTATGSPSASTCGGRRWPRGAGPVTAATSGRRSSSSTAKAVRGTSSPT